MSKIRAPKRIRERAWQATGVTVAGLDEVGRGAWAGPLVAAAVVLDPDYQLRGLRDSKVLLAAERERVAKRIRQRAVCWSIGVAEVGEINQLGLTGALHLAGSRALGDLSEDCVQVLLDGKHNYLTDEYPCETIIDGDALEQCIAAASIIAKVYRDQLMRELHQEFPEYGFALHKGYGTPQHRRALAEHGPSDLHRTYWAPINKLLQTELPLETLPGEPASITSSRGSSES